MKKMMKALCYKEPGDGSITQLPIPECGDEYVLLKVEAASICKNNEKAHNSKNSMWKEMPREGVGLQAKYPLVPGHEYAGVVAAVGKKVKTCKVGDRISADNAAPCGKCYYCEQDLSNYCNNYGSIGLNINGAFAQYLVVHESKVVSLPDHMSFDDGCFIEPTACAIHCMDRLNIKYGDNILVFGTGSNGMIMAQLAKHSNANAVIAVGSTQAKLDILESYGVDTVLMDRNDYSKHEAIIMERFPYGVDGIVDTTSSIDVVRSFPRLLKKGGKIVAFTFIGDLDATLPFTALDFLVKELTFTTSCCQAGNFGRARDAIASGKVKVDKLISRVYPLDKYFEALDYNLSDTSSLKVIIHPWD